MACFIAPATEAVVVTVAKKIKKKSEVNESHSEGSKGTSWATKVSWLTKMLWGGAYLLLIEHIWHGEVVPFYPFITAMKTAEDTAEMLQEIATTGVCMAALVTAVWVAIVAVVTIKERKQRTVSDAE